ncbi:DUF881 domain-containing protein [Nakamurella deserti]|uniref:DUF881 domain-containing protein n=1 Tax=Nakamurella deserti TaxID=2164074 RepID=UPI000DBEA415|nr:DUF881 domain-containing protein [Nakamurella deserti]
MHDDSPTSGSDRNRTVAPGPRRSRRRWQVAVTVVCLAGGFLFGTARSYSGGDEIRPRNVELSGLINEAQQRVGEAEAVAQTLQRQIDAAAGQDVSPQVAEQRTAADQLAPAAGLTPVEGPGVTVTMTDAPRDSDGNYPADANPDDLVVHQQDVQSVVNALWAGGAEAMTIMDQRVIATSAVRCIGNTLLLMGRAYSPPFVVSAIGPSGPMIAAIEAEPGVRLFRQYVDRFNLGFEIEIADDVRAPAYDGLVRMTAAQEVPR